MRLLLTNNSSENLDTLANQTIIHLAGYSSPANLDLTGNGEVLNRVMTCGTSTLDPVVLGTGAYIALDYLRPDSESVAYKLIFI
ncbi:hypothetical protein SCLCIDRAFT_1217070 [Scleroderma citrinum Foug A]|uniref:Uncharacterized protein n=1 Tax=Scleroderma citrinum Foug A TaxID=1036808 RepID=A0A0C2ZEX6_9AGAM|nr:hypothetical protein SCLCIDRAFT_1217070 [Scleroderma citrinum Foug A]